MQATTPLTEERINWALALKSLVAALSLAGVSARSGSLLPMYGAVLIAAWAVVKPLRLTSWALSPGLVRFVGQTLARVVALAVAAFLLSFMINSSLPVLATLGGVLFLALLGVSAVMAARAVWASARRWMPRAWSWATDAVSKTRMEATAVWGAMIGR